MRIITREEARARGLKWYFTGEPCKRGHIADRMVSNKTCRECSLELKRISYAKAPERILSKNRDRVKQNPAAKRVRDRAYYIKNSVKAKEQKQRRYAMNCDAIRDQRRKYYEANKESELSRNRAYRAANQWRHSMLDHKRRAIKSRAVPEWVGEFDEFVFEEAYALAKLRENAFGIEWHIDHMVPLAARTASGLHSGMNVQVIPARMNIAKRNKMVLTNPGEWIVSL